MAKAKVNEQIENIVTGVVPDNKWVTIAGVASVFTTCIACLVYFATLLVYVITNNEWPNDSKTWIVLIGPVLAGWQYMDVRKTINTIMSGNNGFGSIIKEVAIRRLGGVPKDDKKTNKEE